MEVGQDQAGAQAVAQSGGDAPATAQQTATTGQTPDQRFVNVPADQLGDWGGRYGEALKDAREYRRAQQSGVFQAHQKVQELGLGEEDFGALGQLKSLLKNANMTMAQYVEYINGQGQATEEATPAAVTPETVEQAVAKALEKQFQAQSAAQQRAAQERAVAESRQMEAKAMGEVLTKLGLKADSPYAKRLQGAFTRIVMDAALEAVPSYLQGKARAEAEHEAMYGPTAPEALAKAQAEFEKFVLDLRNESVASHAQTQQQLPGGTLGGGAGSAADKVDFNALSHEQKLLALAGKLPGQR